MSANRPRTLFEKVWDNHVVSADPGAPTVIYIDLHLVHEVTSPQAFTGLREKGLKVRRPDRTVATIDHSVPTTPRSIPIMDVMAAKQIEQMRTNAREFGITLRTIRFYEDKGLLAPRRVNGTRVYTRRDRARLALILRSKAIGASLADIKHYLDLYGTAGEGRQQQLRWLLGRTDAAIAELEQKRVHIEATLAELRLINSEVRRHLETR